MIKNRSVPTDAVLPHIYYRNVADAMIWLTEVFGFSELYSYGENNGQLAGAQMRLCDAVIMLHGARPNHPSPFHIGSVSTQTLTVFLEDAKGHFDSAKVAGANIVEELHETVYGELQYQAEDLDGHCWIFSEHLVDRRPDEWGAKAAAGSK